MDTLNAIFSRTSVRAYRPVQIPQNALKLILEAGCAAPVVFGSYDSLPITVIQNHEVKCRSHFIDCGISV